MIKFPKVNLVSHSPPHQDQFRAETSIYSSNFCMTWTHLLGMLLRHIFPALPPQPPQKFEKSLHLLPNFKKELYSLISPLSSSKVLVYSFSQNLLTSYFIKIASEISKVWVIVTVKKGKAFAANQSNIHKVIALSFQFTLRPTDLLPFP